VVLPSAGSLSSSTKTLSRPCRPRCDFTRSSSAMAKSSSKRAEPTPPQRKGSKGFIAVDKKAFDPSIASLFATSVRSISSTETLQS
jgi:hypothetical protein